jgi:hypothetical protein
MGKRGPVPARILYKSVRRIQVTEEYGDLVPFFKMLDQMPRGRSNLALLAAIRGGASAARESLGRNASTKSDKAIDDILGAFD